MRIAPETPKRYPNSGIRLLSSFAFLAAAVFLAFAAGRQFLSMRPADIISPSSGLTARRSLSDYFQALRYTAGDTPVFVFSGDRPGGNILIVGGTHPNEPAGVVAAVGIAENLRTSKGKIVIIPWANASGFTHSDPQEGNPQRFFVETASGRRGFRLGSRATNPVDQWPDPAVYINPMGQRLAGVEARNLNRAYPGNPDGFLTEKVAFGIMEVIRREKIDLGIDLHESAPEYPVINAIVFHENSAELAATAEIELQSEGFEFRLEASPLGLRGLSHREWGDAAGIKAVLLETANPSQGRLKGAPSASLVIDGKDKYYLKAAELGRLFVPYGQTGIPLHLRVARHLAGFRALLASLAELEPAKAVEIENVPSPSEVMAAGLAILLK
jgi:hypothetical protein